jgi:hypothetical protein
MTDDDQPPEFPPMAFMGSVVDSPELGDDEWTALEADCCLTLSEDMRERINQQIWWCQWEKGNAVEIPRMSVVKRRLKEFVQGVDMALGAVGYMTAAHIKSVGDRPPISIRMIDQHGAKVWYALMNATRSTNWKHGYWTKRALERSGETDDVLLALHALGYTAARAIEGWENDKGGQIGGGDRHFAIRLIEILHEAGVAVAYTQDRTADAGREMTGLGWSVFRYIWSIRPETFTATEHSTLGNLYRAAYKRFKERTAPN